MPSGRDCGIYYFILPEVYCLDKGTYTKFTRYEIATGHSRHF